jgi:DNA-directed RNA polymerase subunit RPC12/RpoP
MRIICHKCDKLIWDNGNRKDGKSYIYSMCDSCLGKEAELASIKCVRCGKVIFNDNKNDGADQKVVCEDCLSKEKG